MEEDLHAKKVDMQLVLKCSLFGLPTGRITPHCWYAAAPLMQGQFSGVSGGSFVMIALLDFQRI